MRSLLYRQRNDSVVILSSRIIISLVGYGNTLFLWMYVHLATLLNGIALELLHVGGDLYDNGDDWRWRRCLIVDCIVDDTHANDIDVEHKRMCYCHSVQLRKCDGRTPSRFVKMLVYSSLLFALPCGVVHLRLLRVVPCRGWMMHSL